MARILITGSTDGLGLLAARRLSDQGQRVTLHARNRARANDAREALPEAEAIVVGDLSTAAEVRDIADQANALGRYDAVIHNAAVGYREPWIETTDGVSHVFAVNVLAPYLLTALITPPDRLVYLSSGMHLGGDPEHLADLAWADRPWNGAQAYSDSKLFDIVLAFAVARRWPGTLSNAVEPGWVATRMGGPAAPDDLELGALTQAWLAVGDDREAQVSGRCFYHQRPARTHAAVHGHALQELLLARCAALTGTTLP